MDNNVLVPEEEVEIYDMPPLGRKRRIMRTLVSFSFVVLILFSIGVYATYKVSQWFDTHKIEWRSPIQSPIVIRERESVSPVSMIKEAHAQEAPVAPVIPAVVEKAATPAAMPELTHIVDSIRKLESSGGLRDGCKKKGLINGYGYRQNSKEFVCYKTHAEVRALVTKWVQDKQERGFNFPEMMCYYNTGNRTEDCTYYQHYLRL